MSLTNMQVSKILLAHAQVLEETDDNPYRVRAYRRAATQIDKWPRPLSSMVESGQPLTLIPYVGEKLAAQIKGILETGKVLPSQKPTPLSSPILYELTQLPGIGPKRAAMLHHKLNINTLAEFHMALASGKLREVPGFGPNFKLKIQKKTPPKKSTELRFFHAYRVINLFLKRLKELNGVKNAWVSSSFRRKRELVSNAEILVILEKENALIGKFTQFSYVKNILEQNKKIIRVQLHSGLVLTLRVIKRIYQGAAWLCSTGSEKHIKKLQALAHECGMVLSDEGLYQHKRRLKSTTEENIYQQLSLQYIPPELREDRGEIEAAKRNALPQLVKLSDIRGNLHTHTNASDGQVDLKDMVEAGFLRGYEYLAITDHSPSLKIANGMSHEELLHQIRAIDKINEKLKGMVILKSMEIDILEDGSLDLPTHLLKELDITVCSVHSKFRLPEKKQTERILRAMDNPYFNILGHATGRLIKSRPPYEVNMQRILQHAKESSCILELNAQPYRLDINDEYCLMAKKMGVKIAISSDAHTIAGLDYMQFGIFQAQRGWLEAEDVVNTYPLEKLKKILIR